MNPYKILQIREDATLDEVEQAYRKKAAKHHPDMGGDDWAFMQVQEAYETLKAKLSGQKESPKSQQTTSRKPNPKNNSKPNQQSGARAQNTQEKTQRSTAHSTKPEQSSQPARSAPPVRPTAEPKPSNSGQTQAAHTSHAMPSHDGWFQSLQKLFIKPLPLQAESACFVLFSTLDIIFTGYLIHRGGREVNPIAAWILQQWNVRGLVTFKMLIVAAVLLVIHLIALKHPKIARRVLWFGCLVVGTVAAYGGWLLNR